MPEVIVEMPDLEGPILQALREMFIEPALEVAKEVPALIKDMASLNNTDIDGQQMPPKKPRPKNNPTNNPGLPLVDTGNMFDNARWVIEQVSEDEVEVVYSPPDYLEYLISKDPENGGRKWITNEKINDDVRIIIEEKLAVALTTGGASGPSGFDNQPVPEGFTL